MIRPDVKPAMPAIGQMRRGYALQNYCESSCTPASITTLEDDKDNIERVNVDAVAANYNLLHHLMSHYPRQRNLCKTNLIDGLCEADKGVCYKLSGGNVNSYDWARDEADSS